MTDERRYKEDEVKEIFEAAAKERDSHGRAVITGEGLTLGELQAIGREVGLTPERIADAASELELRRNVLPRRTYFGMPISVGRTADLPRAPTDREWEQLVAELRQTFRARGQVGSHGSIREWTNGNLHAYVEPTETGHRLRLGTLKGNAMTMGGMGIAGILMGLFVLVTILLTGKAADGFFAPLFLGAMGVAALTSSLLSLPRWAREREEQMEHIVSRAHVLIGSETKAEDGSLGGGQLRA
jgi:hypothetical protein